MMELHCNSDGGPIGNRTLPSALAKRVFTPANPEPMLCKRYVMKTIKTNCLNCENEFEAAIKEINRGNGKYCSQSCSVAARVRNLKPLELNAACSYCLKIST
jgi:hypothetical protein